jgi:arylsulfatase
MAKKKQGTTNDDFTLSVDLAPTILSAVGITPPKTMQGADMAPLYLAKQKPRWRDEFFYEHPCISNAERIPESEALVRKEWKYIYWPMQDVEQLFHLKADPREEHDQANNPERAAVLEEMRQRFHQLKAEAKG